MGGCSRRPEKIVACTSGILKVGASCWCCAVTTAQSCVWRSALTAGLLLLPAKIGRCVFGMFRIFLTHRKPLQAVVLQVWTRREGRCNNLLSRSLPAFTGIRSAPD